MNEKSVIFSIKTENHTCYFSNTKQTCWSFDDLQYAPWLDAVEIREKLWGPVNLLRMSHHCSYWTDSVMHGKNETQMMKSNTKDTFIIKHFAHNMCTTCESLHGVVWIHELHTVVSNSGRVQMERCPHVACVVQQMIGLAHTRQWQVLCNCPDQRKAMLLDSNHISMQRDYSETWQTGKQFVGQERWTIFGISH